MSIQLYDKKQGHLYLLIEFYIYNTEKMYYFKIY